MNHIKNRMQYETHHRLLLAAACVFTVYPGALGQTASQPTSRAAAPADVEVVCVDDNATSYATFQSHNQKMVGNRRGIFMAYIRSRNEAYTAQQWRLIRSTDGGSTFTTLYEATHATNPPVIETDEQDNIYLVRPDFQDGHAYLYRFRAADEYRVPVVSTIENGAAGKFAMVYDARHALLYYFAHNNTFHVVTPDGTVQRRVTLLREGTSAALQYPLLSLAPDGTLYAAWTTQKHGLYMYWDIHVMASKDRGEHWQTLQGKPLEPPIVCDETGPTERVTLDDEFDSHTWLANCLVRNNRLHMVYLAQTSPPRMHYLRYDLATGRQDIHLQPAVRGERLSLMGLDGFFASRAARPESALYCVMNDGGRIACLVSRDDGRTWHDHAVTRDKFAPYAIGGCRELTADGHIIGAFTDQVPTSPTDPTPRFRVFFFRIKG